MARRAAHGSTPIPPSWPRAPDSLGGSDWPVSTPDPIAAAHVAVNRRMPAALADGDYDPFLPEQALDLATVLPAYTAGGAWVNHLDDGGRISEGALADLVVLDRDPFLGPPEMIADATVIATYVEGNQVHP